MEEARSIEWSVAAVKQLDDFYNFILIKWSYAAAEKFLDQVMEFEGIVAVYPNAFIQSAKRKKYRIGLIHRHVSAIFEVHKSKVIIVALIDNRMRPKYR